MEKNNAPNKVWLSEDGTGIIRKAVYDVATNQLVGINLSIDDITGMPITCTYVARSLGDIERHMRNTLSSLVYVIMAQPIKPNCPPFVLQLFGTNNKFTSVDVLNRWKFTITELEK